MPLELILPVLAVALAFVGYCWYDLARMPGTRYLPKWAWAIVCVVTIPLGGLAYLLVGRSEHA